MKRIRCFLDVDGVISPDVPNKDFKDWEPWTYLETAAWGIGKSYPLLSSRELGRALLALPIDIHWLTDWKHQANYIAPKWDLPDNLPVCYGTGSNGHQMPKEWWKRRIIQKWCDEVKEPFVWLDDNLRMFALDWQKRTNTVAIARKAGVPHLALSMNCPSEHPNPGNMGKNHGLTLADLKLIEVFCNNVLGTSPG